MSTRAVYTFKDIFFDEPREFHVYKHHDGYPASAAEWIKLSTNMAWDLPRFEADEFACAFIAANKGEAGGMRMTKHYNDHQDLAFRYEISCKNGKLYVRAFEIDFEECKKSNYEKMIYKQIFFGTLDEFKSFALTKAE